MDVRISGKNLEVTDGMKVHLEEKLARIKKYSPAIVEARAVLKKERRVYRAEVTVHASHFDAFGDGRQRDNIYTAIDLACERVTKQLKKRKERIRDHYRGLKHKRAPQKAGAVEAEPGEGDLRERIPEIVRVLASSLELLSPAEAGLRLAASQESFFVFLNSETNQVNLIFEQKGGVYGLLDPGLNPPPVEIDGHTNKQENKGG